MSIETLSLPSEPDPGNVVEIVNGANQGNRYLRDDDGTWRQIAPYARAHEGGWSGIWWAVTEDAAGGNEVKVMSSIDAANDPLFSMRYYQDSDIENGYLWVKLAVSLDRPWRNWHGAERTDAEMDGSFCVPLATVAAALQHEIAP